jgi:hypothetical protein
LRDSILPILPVFISYLSGTAANEAKNSQVKLEQQAMASPLFINNTVNESLPITAAVTKKAASQEYHKFK